jgi:hypothetical protein
MLYLVHNGYQITILLLQLETRLLPVIATGKDIVQAGTRD